MSRTLEELREAVLGPDKAREKASPQQRPRLAPYSARELQHRAFDPLTWFIQDLIGPGLWLLAGPPKVGKSWLLLGLLLAITQGGLALGSIRVQRRGALYLALEDNARRIRSRLAHLVVDDTDVWPEDLHVLHEAPRLDEGLVDALDEFLDDHDDVDVVVIDTLARIRPARNKVDDAYTGDSRVMEALQAVAMRHDVAIIVVHHVRKAAGVDVFETVSGTFGLTGPVDGLLVLQRVRGEADAKLHITGRDVEERELALNFESRSGTWKLLGDAKRYAHSAERRAILDALERQPGLRPKQIAEAVGLSHESVRHLVLRLRDEALVTSDAGGHYSLVHSLHSTPGEPSSTAQGAVNGGGVSHSQHHSPSNSFLHTVNGVNERDKATAAQLYTLHKHGKVGDTDLSAELDVLFAKKRATKAEKARILEIAAQVLP